MDHDVTGWKERRVLKTRGIYERKSLEGGSQSARETASRADSATKEVPSGMSVGASNVLHDPAMPIRRAVHGQSQIFDG